MSERINLNLSRLWDRQLQGDLPDCRLRYQDRQDDIVMRGQMPWSRVYCGNCSAAGGLVTEATVAFAFYLCNVCAARNGPPPGCHEVDVPSIGA